MPALAAHGLDSARAIAEAPVESLAQCVTPEQAQRLKAWAARNTTRDTGDSDSTAAGTERTAPVLIVDDRYPGQIVMDGRRIALQEKQYRLARVLAETPGECVPYERIYTEVWGDSIVEPNQMHFQKSKLIKAIEAELPGRGKVIATAPKRGFRLELGTGEVVVNHGASAVIAGGAPAPH